MISAEDADGKFKKQKIPKNKMNKLLIVGTVAFDAIETPFGKTDKILGGAATYISLSASQFGVRSGIVSVVGGDYLSRR